MPALRGGDPSMSGDTFYHHPNQKSWLAVNYTQSSRSAVLCARHTRIPEVPHVIAYFKRLACSEMH